MIISAVYDWILIMAAGAWLLPHAIRFLDRHGRTECNYEGLKIPSSLGIFIWLLIGVQAMFLQMLSSTDSVLFKPLRSVETIYDVYLAAATVVFVLGWLDDTIGAKTVKGFKGHWRYWREENTFSMGAVKALGTGAASIWALNKCNPEGSSLWHMALQLLLLMLMTNALNLLDVRPGRACKAFLALALIPLVSGNRLEVVWLVMPVTLGGLLLFPGDVRGKLMLGDAGSNLLGFSLGFWLVLWSPFWLQLTALFGCAVLHYIAETDSITGTIERHRLLNWMDRLGRV